MNYKEFKRFFDILMSLLLLVLLLPVFIILALLVKLGSSGPTIYKSERVGFKGKHFMMYKFRSMVKEADKIRVMSTSNDDARLTPMGKIIRKWHIDELPQLVNILKGEMSFVGPRPEVPKYANMFNSQEKKILSVRPGLTDLASIKFHNEGELLRSKKDPDRAYEKMIRPEKIKLQLAYVEKQGFFLDMKIILKTLSLIVKHNDL